METLQLQGIEVEVASGEVRAGDLHDPWGESPDSRTLVHRWRSQLDAVMVGTGTALADVVAGLREFHVNHRQVSCPWEAKGTVMRLLNQQYKDRRADLIDGIKILLGEGEWVLVLPDPDFPRFHIYAEARTDGQAQELADRYVRIVEGLQE